MIPPQSPEVEGRNRGSAPICREVHIHRLFLCILSFARRVETSTFCTTVEISTRHALAPTGSPHGVQVRLPFLAFVSDSVMGMTIGPTCGVDGGMVRSSPISPHSPNMR